MMAITVPQNRPVFAPYFPKRTIEVPPRSESACPGIHCLTALRTKTHKVRLNPSIRDAHDSRMQSGIKIAATLHKFYSDRDSLEYGNEQDLVATYAITKNLGLLANYAI